MRVKISTFVPVEDAPKVRRSLGSAGAGKIGEYSFCSFSVVGVGRFTPSKNASPHTGQAGRLESVQEEKIEVVCEKSEAKTILTALREAHPYEEVAFDIVPIIEESEL